MGASLEGLVIEQVLAHLSQKDRPAGACLLRTADRQEADLVLARPSSGAGSA